jgi:hypothetical protein
MTRRCFPIAIVLSLVRVVEVGTHVLLRWVHMSVTVSAGFPQMIWGVLSLSLVTVQRSADGSREELDATKILFLGLDIRTYLYYDSHNVRKKDF